MIELFEKLGIEVGLIIGQAFNFFLLLIVVTFFVYKPLLRVIKERRREIEIGLEKAKEAEIRLSEIDKIGKEKLKRAEEEASHILKDSEVKAKLIEQEVRKRSEEKYRELLEEAQRQLKKQLEENEKIVFAESASLIRKIIMKTVEIEPGEIDEALVNKAIQVIKKESL